MEYADGGDLFSLIKSHQKNSTLIDEDLIWKIFIQSIRGLKYLHENKIMHRDLKVKLACLLLTYLFISVPIYS